MFYPQGNFYAQGNLGYPQGSFGYPQGGLGQQNFQSTPHAIPFANTLYGYPQLTPYFAQSFTQAVPQVSNWQHFAQLAAQSPVAQQPAGISGLNGITNGASPPVGVWQQQQPGSEQINPALLQQSQLQQSQQQLQRLAQYHQLLAQQFAQLAAQQAAQHYSGNPYPAQFIPGSGQFIPGAGQFVPNQLGTNFVPGITMH